MALRLSSSAGGNGSIPDAIRLIVRSLAEVVGRKERKCRGGTGTKPCYLAQRGPRIPSSPSAFLPTRQIPLLVVYVARRRERERDKKAKGAEVGKREAHIVNGAPRLETLETRPFPNGDSLIAFSSSRTLLQRPSDTQVPYTSLSSLPQNIFERWNMKRK